MIRKVVQITLEIVLVACSLVAGDQGYSMSNLPKPMKPPVTLDKDADGTCLTWSEYWAPRGAEQVLKDLVSDDGKNPYNSGRGWGDFSFKFQINRVVTDDANLDTQGFLINPQALISRGVIAPTITVEFAAIEYLHGDGVVKTWSGNGINANYKVISVNGKKYWSEPPTGRIGGWDWQFPLNHFTLVTFQVPIEMVKFPRRAALGSKPLAENQLEVTTDMTGNTYLIPAIKLAWVKASVKAMAPIFLVHGTNATPDTWNKPDPTMEGIDLGLPDLPAWSSNFNQFFFTFPGLCFNDITLKPNGSIDDNSGLLAQEVSKRLQSVGAKACHIIGHSKGGIDGRAMTIKHYGSPLHENLDQPGHFEVLSLYTLDTPHRGTVLSDIAWNKLNRSNPVADPQWYDLVNVMRWDLPFLHSAGVPDGQTLSGHGAPTGPALEAQMTDKMLNWNQKNVFDFSHKNAQGKPIRFYNTAADADWNNRNGSMDTSELGYMRIPLSSVATSMYRMLYWAKEVQTLEGTTTRNGPNGPIAIPVTILVPIGQEPGQWNDLVVSYSSAVYDGGTLFCPPSLQNFNSINLKNHSTVKNYGMARGIVGQIALDWPVTAP